MRWSSAPPMRCPTAARRRSPGGSTAASRSRRTSGTCARAGVLPATSVASRCRRTRVEGAQAGHPPVRQPLRGLRPRAVSDGARLPRLPGAGAHGRREAREDAARSSPSRSTTWRHVRAPDADGGRRPRRRRPRLSAGRPTAPRTRSRSARRVRLTFRRLHEAAGTTTTSGRSCRHEGSSRRHRRRLHEVRRALRPRLRGADLRRGVRGLRRRRHRPDRDRGRRTSARTCPGPAAASRRCRSATRCASTTGRSRASRTTAPPAPTPSATPAWRSPPGVHDVVLVVGAEKLKDRGGRGLPRFGHPLLAQRQLRARPLRAGRQSLHAHVRRSAARRSPRWR